MMKIEGVIFDWAGTTVDFGCFAPVNVFIDIFKNVGIDVTIEEARAPMGLLKIDHIREMLSMPRISALWEEKFGRAFTEQDVEDLYANFETSLMSSLKEYTDPIPEVVETIERLRSRGLKIGSTTGYTETMIAVVMSNAAKKGYRPDFHMTADGTNSFGRPYPYMIYRNMEALALSAPWNVVKVGDTVLDLKEAIHAAVWSVGIIIGSSEMGLRLEEFNALSEAEREQAIKKTERTFLDNGADFTIRSMSELPTVIEQINALLAEGKRPQWETHKSVLQ